MAAAVTCPQAPTHASARSLNLMIGAGFHCSNLAAGDQSLAGGRCVR